MPDIATTRPTRWLQPRFDQRTVDLLIAVAVTVFAFVALSVGFGGDITPTVRAGVVIVIAGAAIAVRRKWPMPVLAVAIFARIFVTWDVGEELALNLAATVALYTVARHGGRGAGLLAASIGAVVVGLGSALLGDEPFLVELLSELAQGFLPIAVGDAVRTRADRVRELIDAEADARVQAERLRIARDLHDVVAHGLSTIAVQSGVAAHLLDRDPEHARQALETINATGKTSLEELRVMVGVLRSSDDAPLRPTPTDPNDISELLDGAANAGITVIHTVEGCFPDDASDAAAVAFHRIVQEALTNVARHAGTASATLHVQHREDLVELEVRNTGPHSAPKASGSTGVGIVGMRERAESLGGTLYAGPTEEDGFQVVATIPYVRHAP